MESIIEEWRPIEEFLGYEISNLANARSLNYNREKKIKLLKPSFDSKGQYLKFGLTRNGKVYNRTIHRLVAIAFIPNPLNLPQINHLDGDKTNNLPPNLEWCDQIHNSQHSCRVLGNKPPEPFYKGKHGKDVLVSKPVCQIDRLTNEKVKIWDNAVDAGIALGIDNSSIGKAAKGIHHTAGGFKWEYANENA